MITLGDMVEAGLSPLCICRTCGHQAERGERALVARYGADYPLAHYLARLRCRTCRRPPDVVLVWDDGGAAARASPVIHVAWRLHRPRHDH